MIAAARVSCDALDGDGQIAIALRDHGRQLVYLLGRFRRRLDFDPAADAVEDGFGIEGIGCRQHDVCLQNESCHSGMRLLAQARNPYSRSWLWIPGSLVSLAPRNDTLLSTLIRGFARGDLLDQFDDAAAELGVGDACERAGQR